MQSLYLLFTAALCGVALAQMNLPPPNLYILQSGTPLSNPQWIAWNNSIPYTVTVGANVTLGCVYTDPQFQTTIGKWSVSGTIDLMFPLYTNGFPTMQFADLITRYPPVDARVDGAAYIDPGKPIINYVQLINLQPFDMGRYGCYSNFGTTKQTLYANLTLALNSSAVYGVRMVSVDQQLVVAPNSAQSAYSCYVYRGAGSSVDYIMWFDKCQWSNLGQDVATRSVSCNNTPSTYYSGRQVVNNIGVINTTLIAETLSVDMYPAPVGSVYYGFQYWVKNVIRDSYSLSLSSATIYASGANGWLNRTLGCFTYRNATGVNSDYVTFVQQGVDLDLDPVQFACGRHHYIAQANQLVSIYCTVMQPAYRTFGTAAWEVWTPIGQTGTYSSVTVQSQNDINNQKWGRFVILVSATSSQATYGDATQNRIGTGLNVTVDPTTTLNYRYRLVISYPDGNQQRSEYFSIATSASGLTGSGAQGAPQAGKVSTGAGTAVTSWSLLIVVASVVALLRARV